MHDGNERKFPFPRKENTENVNIYTYIISKDMQIILLLT